MHALEKLSPYVSAPAGDARLLRAVTQVDGWS
jgi:hypothetical protein